MYIESNPGELGFPQHRMGPGGEGGWRHHMQSGGPGSEMQLSPQAAMPGMPGAVAPYPMPGVPGMRHHHHRHHGMRGADGVEIMGAAPPAGAPVVMPPTVMAPVSQHSETMAYVATAVLGIGLAFVIYKATR